MVSSICCFFLCFFFLFCGIWQSWGYFSFFPSAELEAIDYISVPFVITVIFYWLQQMMSYTYIQVLPFNVSKSLAANSRQEKTQRFCCTWWILSPWVFCLLLSQNILHFVLRTDTMFYTSLLLVYAFFFPLCNNLMSFNKCMHSCNLYLYQDNEYFHHPRMFTCAP